MGFSMLKVINGNPIVLNSDHVITATSDPKIPDRVSILLTPIPGSKSMLDVVGPLANVMNALRHGTDWQGRS
jgi:hypothetical protein